MKLYIPDIGDSIVLGEDWSFQLHEEERNKTLIKIMVPEYKPVFNKWFRAGYNEDWSQRNHSWTVTLPKGTVLTVDRIYIRQGLKSYSSVTFKTIYHGKKVRFWVKLHDVNNIIVV